MTSNVFASLEVVSRDIGITSKLIYDVVMHTAPEHLRISTLVQVVVNNLYI